MLSRCAGAGKARPRKAGLVQAESTRKLASRVCGGDHALKLQSVVGVSKCIRLSEHTICQSDKLASSCIPSRHTGLAAEGAASAA